MHTLNAWSSGSWAPFWVWLGTPAANPWLGIIAVLVVGGRLYFTARVARAEGHALAYLWRQAACALLAAAIAVAISDPLCSRVLKPAIAEPRPCTNGMSDVPPPLVCGSGFGMPSTHASNTAAVAAAIQNPVLGLIAGVVGVSRVVNGQHWPGDVLAGWAIGGMLGLTTRRFLNKVFTVA